MFSQRSSISEPVSVKGGLVPTFKDGDNSRAYRRLEIYRIMYMANITEKQMTFGQQWYALVIKVPGNARLRIDSFTRRVALELSREDFKNVIDTFLSLIDPVHREVQLWRTAEAWRALQYWEHRGKKSFEDYWLTFSRRCLAYMEMHETAEGKVAVRDLLALTCVHNANLSRSEFTSILQSANHWQELCSKEEKNATLALKGFLLDSPATEGPATATAAYSRQSELPRVEPSSMSHRSAQDLDGQELLEEVVDETVDVRSGSQMDTASKATQVKLHLDDINTHTVSAYQGPS